MPVNRLFIRQLLMETFFIYCLLRVVLRADDVNELVKTEYKPIMRKLVFIVPRSIRFFTPVLWIGALLIEIMFFLQAIDIFLSGNDVYMLQYTIYKVILGFILFMFACLLLVIEDIKKYAEYKRDKDKKVIRKLKETEKYDLDEGKVIRQLYYDKTASDNRHGIVLIIPFCHIVNPDGDFYINGKRKEVRIKSQFGYANEYDVYYDNVMAYDELTHLFNTLGYDVMRFGFSPDDMAETIGTLCMEIKNIVGKLDTKNILLLGHGVRGCIEAEVLSTYIETSGMILLCGAATEILDSIRLRFVNEYKRRLCDDYRHTREYKKYFRDLDKLPVSSECGACTSKGNCAGYCSKYVAPYLDSLSKIKKDDLINTIKEYNHKILIIYAQKALDYDEKAAAALSDLDSEKIKLLELSDVYETFRKPERRDYRYTYEISLLKENASRELNCELVNAIREYCN
ncbi:MAG: hypothetical protein NC313_16740 [Butyrivibrio sp.]|nr:hypothetical protein [Butyrivibrio sp.]